MLLLQVLPHFLSVETVVAVAVRERKTFLTEPWMSVNQMPRDCQANSIFQSFLLPPALVHCGEYRPANGGTDNIPCNQWAVGQVRFSLFAATVSHVGITNQECYILTTHSIEECVLVKLTVPFWWKAQSSPQTLECTTPSAIYLGIQCPTCRPRMGLAGVAV